MLLALLVAASLGVAAAVTTTTTRRRHYRQRYEHPQITKNADNAATTITVGSKNFTEQKVLGEIYAQALAAAGYNVKTELNLGDEKIALKAVESGEIDAYPEYTGTALCRSSTSSPTRSQGSGTGLRRRQGRLREEGPDGASRRRRSPAPTRSR